MEKDNASFSDSRFLEILSITKIGTWDWDLRTNRVIYSAEWARIAGYELHELEQDVRTWENLVVPEDLDYANEQITKHLAGETPIYEAEFRMKCKDGKVIWCQDKGKVIEYDENGAPIRFVGVIQDVSKLKETEINLKDNKEALDLSVSVACFGMWDWDIPANRLKYNDEYLNMLGYEQKDANGSFDEWANSVHPDDRQSAKEKLDAYVSGKIPSYEVDIRMRHKDGHYIWTRDTGRVVEWDSKGRPVRLIGGHLNIDELKRSQESLTKALYELQTNKNNLELEVQRRTEDLIRQDRMLMEVNEIAKTLLRREEDMTFDDIIHECLRSIGEITEQNRVYVWRDTYDEGGVYCCVQVFEWVRGISGIQGNSAYEYVPYEVLPTFRDALNKKECLNSYVYDLAESEKEILESQGVQSILIAPINIGGTNWGFIGIDNCESREIFSESEENMLMMSGFLIANAIQKRLDDAKMREAEERTQIMLNATPLCCNLWDRDENGLLCIACNDEAVRLFDLSNRQEYIDRFFDLSPEYQPYGETSRKMAFEYIEKAFDEGYISFEWLHQNLRREPIPSEITLVRVKYQNRFIVAGYTRDLREHKAMLGKINKVQEDLAAARDEAIANSKSKSEFLAKMSHEIRTPMNAIVGMSELILRENIPASIKDRVYSVKSASANLLSIINDILDFSKIESGKLEIIKIKYSLASLVNDVTNIICMRLADAGNPVLLTVNIDPDIPNYLIGDEIRIRQILLNMLSNAVKYTKEGYVKYSITGELRGNNAVYLKMEVTDTGIGIKEQDIGRLFGEFVQVDTLKNKGVEGTGLGLAITHNLCKLMDGSISVRSVYGKGSTFTVELPQELPEPEPEQEYKKFASVSAPEEKSVLIYESREIYLESLRETLGKLNVKCGAASNYSEFYEAIRSEKYSFIFFPAILMENVKNLADNLRIDSKFILLMEYNDEVTVSNIKCLSMPAHALSIANILNEVNDDNTYTESRDKILFIAPDARVLIVDDIETNLRVAEGLMQPYQMRIDTCESGMEAIEFIKENSYDIVFMDHMMPIMDGVEATLAIRKNPECVSLPIVALTANAISGVKEMFLSNGFDDFLAKPIEITKLNSILEKWIPESKKKEAAGSGSAEEEPVFQIDGIDVPFGMSMSGGSVENYLNILSVFYNDGRNKIREIQACVENNNIALYTTYVHALKSALASIGAAELSALAKSLEFAGKIEDIKFISDNTDNFLQGMALLLENISYVTNINHSGSGDMPPEERSKKLRALKNAIVEMDAVAANDILRELQNNAGGSEADKIEQIANNILLCEYDEAVNIIDSLL